MLLVSFTFLLTLYLRSDRFTVFEFIDMDVIVKIKLMILHG